MAKTEHEQAVEEALAAIMRAQRCQFTLISAIIGADPKYALDTKMNIARHIGSADAGLEMAMRRLGYE